MKVNSQSLDILLYIQIVGFANFLGSGCIFFFVALLVSAHKLTQQFLSQQIFILIKFGPS